MDDDHRRLLLSIIERIDAQIPRLDRLDAHLDRVEARLDAVDARLDRLEGRFDRMVSLHADQLRTLSEGVAAIAGAQADLVHQVGAVNERFARMVEASVRGRTGDAERSAALEARVTALESQVAALAGGAARP